MLNKVLDTFSAWPACGAVVAGNLIVLAVALAEIAWTDGARAEVALADEPAPPQADKPVSQSAVGVAAQVRQIVIAGAEIEARPADDRQAPLVVRVLATFRHGSDFRYDIEYYGLAPGQHDLRDYLRRKDGTSMDSAQPLLVEIQSRLPGGHVLPSSPQPTALPQVGGYRALLYVALGLWLLAIGGIVLGRRRRKEALSQVEEAPTLVQSLRPLLDQAVAGRLSPEGRAELERLLLGYWRQRLNLEDEDPVEALATIKAHAEAGLLLRQVEDWLHRPEGAGTVDIAAILRPYQGVLEENEVARMAEPGHG